MEKGILITGAMGGLGSALIESAKQLQDVDYIVATDINSDIIDFYKEDTRILGLVMDVSSQKSIQKVRENIHKQGISIKYIVNNAGIAMFFPISEASENQLDKIIKVNAYGPVLTISTFIHDLIENRGRVVQISSDNIRLSGLFQPYASSKIVLESLSVAMRQELGLHGIKLVLIRPGAIRTSLLNEVEHTKYLNVQSVYAEFFKKFTEIAQKEVGKIIEPMEVAKLVMKAIRIKHPKLAYSINKNAKISFLVKFPQKWIDFLMKKTVFPN